MTYISRSTTSGATPRPGDATSSRARRALAAAVVTLVLVAGGAAIFYLVKPTVAVTSPSEYIQLTNFSDSATAPSLSPDGRMVTFKRGGDSFLGPGQIFVKLLPNGESVQLTTSPGRKYGPVFTPDGTRVAYTNRDGCRGSGIPGLCRCSAASRCGSYPTPPDSPGLRTIWCCSPKSSPASTWGS